MTAAAPAHVSVLDSEALDETPGVNLDDRLRSVPGFSLFRRSSSLVAHPTTQGVSLRGLGSTGASRTLVLKDGAPLNDPFGGWIYWTRLNPDEVARVEISRGASTSVFGDRAMGGAIHIISRAVEAPRLSARYEAGSHGTHEISAGLANAWSKAALSGSGRAFTTDGYFIVPESVRGDVDRRANVRFVTGSAHLDFFRSADRLSLNADILAEERHNGTVLQTNSTGLGQVSLDYQRESGRNGYSILAFHTRSQFHSVFSAIGAGRDSERLTFRQRVPSEGAGGALLYRRTGRLWNVVAGGDLFRSEGFSIDSLFPAGTRTGGGSLASRGVFAQSDVHLGPAVLFAGARADNPGRGGSRFTPNAGVAWGQGRLRARASAYRAFRAPTLNELYREFRAGNAVTRANPALSPERLTGVEAGVDFIASSTRLRVSAFRNSLDQLITNVTLSTAPDLIVRQRQNAGAALGKGMEIEGHHSRGPWHAEAAYLYADSRFAAGERVPQVPRHQGSAQLTYDRRSTLISAGVRSFARQFEDELNQFLLPGFATVQLLARRKLTPQISALAAFENLLDRSYLTGFSPTSMTGAPRLWRVGLRWEGQLP